MTITINNKSEINAKGNLSNGKCKPILCINDGEVYTSGVDAAKAYNIYPAEVSKICCGKKKSINGKRFCFVDKTTEHLDEITSYIREMNSERADLEAKAEAYDKLMAHKRFIAQMETELEATRQSIAEMQEKAKNLEEQIAVLKREEV